MGYISAGEDFQMAGAFGCGGNCGCAPCAARRLGNHELAEWYEEEEEEPHPPARPATGNRGGSAMGEPPQRLVLQTPSLLQRDPTPPWQRRLQNVMSQGLTLRPPFQSPGTGMPPPPRRLDLSLSPRFQQELWEKWERERRNREMFAPMPPPPPTRSLGQAIRTYIDGQLNSLMDRLGIPQPVRGVIRSGVRDAIGRGAIELLDRTLTSAGVGGEGREAITNSVRAAMETIRVR
ncbi:MAG: hypothetical protein JNK38_10435 [Acidobacteria bacterium]|nr:hypothetical protein [Acidobacteriota bacterium]